MTDTNKTINCQFQSIAQTGGGSKNIETTNIFIKKLFASGKAFLFVAAIAFSFLAMSASSTQAQPRNNYLASDGCYYSHNGVQWTRFCPADRSRTKYYFDALANSRWQRLLYLDTILYSDRGNTFNSFYSYSLMAWGRTYSSGLQNYYSTAQGRWMTLQDYQRYGHLNYASMAVWLRIEQSYWEHYNATIAIILRSM